MEEVAFYLTVWALHPRCETDLGEKNKAKNALSYYNSLWPSKAQPDTAQSYSFMFDFSYQGKFRFILFH